MIAACATNPLSDYLFEYALLVLGFLHIIHGLTKELLSKLAGWEWFYPFLVAVTNFLSSSGLVKLFEDRCIPPKFSEAFTVRFDKSFSKLKEWRWGTVMKILIDMIALESVFDTFWNLAKLLAGSSLEAREFKDDSAPSVNLQLVDEAIRCKKFWCYAKMLLRLQDLLARIAEWAEGCPCHDVDISELPRGHPRRKQIKDAKINCPASGCRAPEVVAGDLDDMTKELANKSLVGVSLVCAKAGLAQEDTAFVVDDFSLGISDALLVLRMKIGHWMFLPYILVGLAVACEDKARSIAIEVLRQFDTSTLPQTLHHRLTHLFCVAGAALRVALEMFIAGATRRSIPVLWWSISKFRFICIVERDIEGVHAKLKKGTSGKARSREAVVSLESGRLSEIEQLVTSPSYCHAVP
jgi:hypothetical protein